MGRLELPHGPTLLGPEDLHAFEDRQALGEAFEAGDEGARRRKAVRRSVEDLAGNEIHPSGRVQPEGVPALGAPAGADPVPFEHYVVATGSGEPAARCEAGRPGPDYDRVNPIDASSSADSHSAPFLVA